MGCGCSSDNGGFLNWGTSVRYVFFRWWTAESPIGTAVPLTSAFSVAFATTNVLLVVLSFMYEGLMSFRARLDDHMAHDRATYTASKTASPCRFTNAGSPRETGTRGPFTLSENLVRAGLHAFSYYASQVLMMIFMAYNGYFCASLVLGRFLGYLFFAILLPHYKTGERPKSCCG